MISTSPYYRGITIFQVFVIIVSIVSCENPTTDYDLPTLEDSNNYNDYYFRPYTRYEQHKMDPNLFFRLIYNPLYRVLPKPHTVPDYKAYRKSVLKSDSEIDLRKLLTESKNYENKETHPENNETDDRYAYTNPNHSVTTDKMYYQSNLFKVEHEFANQYLRSNPQPLPYEDFIEVLNFFELLPKHYETGKDFLKARIGLAKFLEKNIAIMLNQVNDNNSRMHSGLSKFNAKKLISKSTTSETEETVQLEEKNYNTELIELSHKDALIQNEAYKQYALRIAYQGKVPLDPKTCNELYGTQHTEDAYFTCDQLKMKLISPAPNQ